MDSPHKGSTMWKTFPCHDILLRISDQLREKRGVSVVYLMICLSWLQATIVSWQLIWNIVLHSINSRTKSTDSKQTQNVSFCLESIYSILSIMRILCQHTNVISVRYHGSWKDNCVYGFSDESSFRIQLSNKPFLMRVKPSLMEEYGIRKLIAL